MESMDAYKQLPNTDSHTCFACSPANPSGLQMEFFTDEKTVFAWVTVPEHLCGWNKVVHGGVITTILDEVMSWSAMYFLKYITMTRTISVDFIKPVYVGNRLKAEGKVVEVEGRRKAVMEGSIHNADGTLCAGGSGDFVLFTPALAKRMGMMDDASMEWYETVINPPKIK
jgi:uncharacterized protein (TIGR00369 family)